MLLPAAVLLLAGCGATSPTQTSAVVTPPVTVAVSPASVNLTVGGATRAFSATVANSSDTAVTWQVNGVAGGDAAVGTISASGLYISPAAMPSSPSVTISAVSVADAAASGSAAITLTQSAATVTVAVAPAVATVQAGAGTQAFAATVSNATNTAVTWQVNGVTGGNATLGTISTGGLYTAPSAVPAQPTVTIAAISAADPTAIGNATVTIVGSAVSVSISPTTSTVAVGTGQQAFTATVHNASSNTVSWEVNGVVGGNASVGTISTAGQYTAPKTAPSSATVTVTAVAAADTTKSASATVTLTVSAPTIGGVPSPSSLVGRVYDFIPVASDPNGRSLSFSVAGRPAWASFNAATGELTGTPAAADVGTAQVTITVSNGLALSSLTFTLAVVSSAPGTATVSWVPPTTRTDGTSLTNLAAYRVYFGTDPNKLLNTVDITNSTVTVSVVPNLTSGTWYFAATAIDANGVESAYSNIASKTI